MDRRYRDNRRYKYDGLLYKIKDVMDELEFRVHYLATCFQAQGNVMFTVREVTEKKDAKEKPIQGPVFNM